LVFDPGFPVAPDDVVVPTDTARDTGDDREGLDAVADVSRDAAPDATADIPTDLGADTGVDAPLDAGADVAMDAPLDAGADVAMDVAQDTAMDLGTDLGTDLGMDVSRDTGSDLGTDVAHDAGADVAMDVARDTGVDVGADVPADQGVDAGVCPPSLPRPALPWSGASISGTSLPLRVIGPGAYGIQVCRSRLCDAPGDPVVSVDRREMPQTQALDVPSAGTYFWRVVSAPSCTGAPSPAFLVRSLPRPRFALSARASAAYGIVPDLDADGVAELVLGAPEVQGFNASGRVVIVRGLATTPGADQVLDPGRNCRGFGNHLGAAGDFNGDGFGDLFASCGNDQVLLFLGSARGVSTSPDLIVHMGSHGAVVAAGDIDGDGYADLALLDGSMLVPAVSVVYGQPRFDTLPQRRFLNIDGVSLAAPGDLNGDGFADLVVGEPAANDLGSGRVHVLFGGAELRRGPVLQPVLGPADFGRRVISVGDLFDDGLPTFGVVSMPDLSQRRTALVTLVQYGLGLPLPIAPDSLPLLVSETRIGVLPDSAFGAVHLTGQGGGYLGLVQADRRSVAWVCPRCLLHSRTTPEVVPMDRNTVLGPVVSPGNLRGAGADAITARIVSNDSTVMDPRVRIEAFVHTQSPVSSNVSGFPGDAGVGVVRLGALLQ